MKLSDFDYTYPEELVAQRPLPERDASRMMVIDRDNKIAQHSSISKLPSFLERGDLLVVNDSKVFPARLIGRKPSGGEIEILLLEETDRDKYLWRAIASRKKRLKVGAVINFGGGLVAEVVKIGPEGVLLQLRVGTLDPCLRRDDKACRDDKTCWNDKSISSHLNNIHALIEKIGLPPLPPYIRRKKRDDCTDEDRERYQTVYAKNTGSAAAPTAGFHLSEKILRECSDKGINITSITLHVGLDTFSPVRVEKIEDHKMHGERYSISTNAIEAIEGAKKDGRRVIAVGTTTVRALESTASQRGSATEQSDALDYRGLRLRNDKNQASSNEHQATSLFIYPGYRFNVVDAILTNFHQPRSTLLMMISAFTGREFILQVYEEAIKKRYRLFSYGDCMFIF